MLTARSSEREVQVVMVDSAAFCKYGLCVILSDEIEDLSATFHFEIPPITNRVAFKLQNIAV